MCKVCAFNPAKADAFASNLLQTLNHGALSLMISLGHRSGLFDTMRELEFATSDTIAGAAGLHERYVREWLGAMATGGVVEVSPDGQYFHLPQEHAAFLTRANASDNMAVFAQYIPTLAKVEAHILACFYNGGGVPYEEYDRFHEVMAEDSGQSVLAALLEYIVPMTGMEEKLRQGIDVMDIGCGSGKALILLAQTFPNSRFYGYDLCEAPIQKATALAAEAGLANIVFEQKDLTHYSHERQYDWITAFDAIHDQGRPDLVLKHIYQALKTNGLFLMQDIDASSNVAENLTHPLGTLLYTVSCMHCMTVSLAQGGLGVGAMWGRQQAQEMLREAGFQKIEIQNLAHDVQNCYYLIRK
ncbi:MAG: class I SAM-dependent methyltransferase [Saprospiraceae bacterium]